MTTERQMTWDEVVAEMVRYRERASASDDLLRQAIEALRHADMFITNGVENGYIRLPSPPDPALETPNLIRAVLTAYDKRGQS